VLVRRYLFLIFVLVQVLLIACLMHGCGHLNALLYGPQPFVDSFDWARERNERGCYRETVASLQDLGRPYCDFSDLTEADFPVTFGILGLEQAHYNPQANAVVYELGNHPQMMHEFTHSILERSKPSHACLSQIAASAVQRESFISTEPR